MVSCQYCNYFHCHAITKFLQKHFHAQQLYDILLKNDLNYNKHVLKSKTYKNFPNKLHISFPITLVLR